MAFERVNSFHMAERYDVYAYFEKWHFNAFFFAICLWICLFSLKVKMEENKLHFRHLMLFYFWKEKNVVQTRKKICIVYGNTIAENTIHKWFAQKWQFWSGRPKMFQQFCSRWWRPKIVTLIKNNLHYTIRDSVEILYISHMSVVRHIESLGYMNC